MVRNSSGTPTESTAATQSKSHCELPSNTDHIGFRPTENTAARRAYQTIRPCGSPQKQCSRKAQHARSKSLIEFFSHNVAAVSDAPTASSEMCRYHDVIVARRENPAEKATVLDLTAQTSLCFFAS